MDLKAIFVIEILKNGMVNLFQILLSYSYDDSRQFTLYFVSFGQLRL